MTALINADTSSGVVVTSDTSGNLALQSAGTTKLTVSSTGVAITGASMTSFGGGVITSGTAVASTSGTSIDFTSIPSWAKRITVMLSGVSTNSTANPYLIQIGPSGGVETSGYVGASSTITSSAVGTTNYTDGFSLRNNNSATTTVSGSMTISLLNSSTNLWIASGVFAQSDAAITLPLAYSKALAGTLSIVRITTTGGTDTFDAGSINILYEG